MKKICSTIKDLRKKHGYNQTQVGEALGLDVTGYGKKELGKSDLTYSQLELLAKFYNMTLVDLVAYPAIVKVERTDEKNLLYLRDKTKELLDEFDCIIKNK